MIELATPEKPSTSAARRITREQGKSEQRRYTLSLTLLERLEHLDELNRQMLEFRGISIDELAQDQSVRRIRRSQS